jgi:signal transduction histidine kinase
MTQANSDLRERTEAAAVAFVLGQVAHDLRTPIGSLSLWLRLLRDQNPSELSGTGALGMVEGSVRALVRFAADLEDAAQIVSGSFRLDHGPVELNALLKETMSSLETHAAVKKVELRPPAGPDPVIVRADRDRLARALDALLSGALTRERQGGSVDATLAVSTTGVRVGIRPAPVGPEGLPQLQERLTPRPSARGGMALALAIARHAIEAHGGRFEASEGTFAVLLPAKVLQA